MSYHLPLLWKHVIRPDMSDTQGDQRFDQKESSENELHGGLLLLLWAKGHREPSQSYCAVGNTMAASVSGH